MKSLFLLFALTASLDDLSWMAGHWGATIDGVEMEEVWLAPKGGVMVGMHRDAKPSKASFEFMRIAVTPEGIVFLAQPGGRPATPFPLVEASPTCAVFENPKHDYPQRIIYSLEEGRLCARVEGEGQPPESWCWSRRSAYCGRTRRRRTGSRTSSSSSRITTATPGSSGVDS